MSIRKPFSHGIHTGTVTVHHLTWILQLHADIKPNHFLNYIYLNYYVNQKTFQSWHSDWDGNSTSFNMDTPIECWH